MTTCPKCNYTRQPEDAAPDYECPQCGVIYAKARPTVEPKANPATTPARRSQVVPAALLVAILGAIVYLNAVGQWQAPWSTSTVSRQPEVTLRTVTYEVTGTARSVNVTYVNGGGGTEQYEVLLPWTKSFTAPSGNMAYISAQNNGVSGSVTVTIKADDQPMKSSTSSGAYVIASADAVL